MGGLNVNSVLISEWKIAESIDGVTGTHSEAETRIKREEWCAKGIEKSIEFIERKSTRLFGRWIKIMVGVRC